MRRIPYFIVDVFTDRQLGGNPLAVFPDRSQLQELELQQIAAEMNLSETVFVQEPSDEAALKRLRIFTPRKELPLAGHPVIGTWYLLASRDLVNIDDAVRSKKAYVVKHENLPEKIIIRHELGVGLLPVTIYRDKGEIGGIVMDQDQPKFGEDIKDVSLIAEALGLESRMISGTFQLPRAVSTGINILIVPLTTRNALSAVTVNLAAFEKVVEEHNVVGIYTFTRDATVDTEMALVSARGFFPTLGVPEDPATGSAAGCLGSYLASTGVLPAKKTVAFQIEQGVDMGRPSRIGVEITSSEGKVSRVRVGGSAVVTAESTLLLP